MPLWVAVSGPCSSAIPPTRPAHSGNSAKGCVPPPQLTTSSQQWAPSAIRLTRHPVVSEPSRDVGQAGRWQPVPWAPAPTPMEAMGDTGASLASPGGRPVSRGLHLAPPGPPGPGAPMGVHLGSLCGHTCRTLCGAPWPQRHDCDFGVKLRRALEVTPPEGKGPRLRGQNEREIRGLRNERADGCWPAPRPLPVLMGVPGLRWEVPRLSAPGLDTGRAGGRPGAELGRPDAGHQTPF